ncbi:MAG: hypothetical protein CND89_04520 [Marine Group II euryarchaeote MED-G38]|nr:hypothetical protein [Euryarchaeota archaeon]OUV24731.1 MAG: hypothetical protein CBC57_06285 [Euryarchaeota archaeon TMED97]PDH22313.1 MAG: hypothetical protein CND89_04520 [Marine Group II euryarchaeote MED-G38]|tara:strand:+ start:13914 stop:14429 length:516 start_codon:yes stop_codon:yes gene_type:complete
MERFDVKRGLVKEITEEGGLAKVAKKYFDTVNDNGKNSFSGSHDIMVSIDAHYNESGALVVDVKNVPPNFDNNEAMKTAQDSRKRWTQFLDEVTGYNSKQRGDKAKEWAKKSSKAKSAISQAQHFMKVSSKVSDDVKEKADSLIIEINTCLENNDFTRAASRGEKLNKLFQ